MRTDALVTLAASALADMVLSPKARILSPASEELIVLVLRSHLVNRLKLLTIKIT